MSHPVYKLHLNPTTFFSARLLSFLNFLSVWHEQVIVEISLNLFFLFSFPFMCRDRIWTCKNLIYWAQYSASYKLILTQPLNKRNTVALPSTADATPSLAHAEYSPLIVWWVVAGWQKKSGLFSWLRWGRQGEDGLSVTGTDQSLCEGKLMKQAMVY